MTSPTAALAQQALGQGGVEDGDATTATVTELDPTERARALFAEGVAHTQAEAWEPAADAFERALALRPAAAIRYNLAAALVELGRYREAQTQLDAMNADPTTSASLRELGVTLEARVRAEAGRISVERSAELADAEVSIDEQPVDEEWLAREIPVTPGAHVVEATWGGRTVGRTEVRVGAGERTHVVLSLSTIEVETPGTPPPQSRSIFEEWGFWVALGAGAVVIGLVIGIGVGLATSGGPNEVVIGNFTPGVITWP